MAGDETLRSHFPRLGVPLSVRSGLERIDHRLRLETLAERLRTRGPLAVRQSTRGLFGDRHLLWLDDGSLLRLKLFWARPEVLAAVLSVHFKSSVGWVVWARSTAGDKVLLAAWSARITPQVSAFPGSSTGSMLQPL